MQSSHPSPPNIHIPFQLVLMLFSSVLITSPPWNVSVRFDYCFTCPPLEAP